MIQAETALQVYGERVKEMNKVYCCYPGGKHKALTMSYDDGRGMNLHKAF